MQHNEILMSNASDEVHVIFSPGLGGVIAYTIYPAEECATVTNIMTLTIAQAEEMRNGLTDALEAEDNLAYQLEKEAKENENN
jgi:hypothetical protein